MNETTEKQVSKANQIILKPIVTLKSSNLSTEKIYTFLVASNANKHQIAQAFEELYSAKATRVNTVTMRSKVKRTRNGLVQKADRKKAYIFSEKELDIIPKA